MKVSPLAVSAVLGALPLAFGQVTPCVPGAFTLYLEGQCTPESLVAAYDAEVFSATGQTSAGACGHDAEADLTAKLAASGLTLEGLCRKVYSDQEQVPYHKAFNRGGPDLRYESEFYNGHEDWQEEVETLYETDDGTRSSRLKDDAEMVRAFHDGTAQGKRVAWPGILPNFQSGTFDKDGNPTCETSAMMCVWPKDRQANDGNGNCATAYDENCVDKDPADNTNLCYVDTSRGNQSTGIGGDDVLVFPGDNNAGEGAIHCHGMAWSSDDPDDFTARYRANNLFYVSAYDHMYVRGYVRNIPGAPMCGCVEQMPTVSRCDCTQVDLTEEYEIVYAADATVTTRFTEVHVDFNACQGINNRRNDLWAYMGRLYYEEKIKADEWGKAGRIITDQGCHGSTKYELDTRGLEPGHDHDVDVWTNVAGREGLKLHEPYGTRAFNMALEAGAGDSPSAENPHYGIIYRACHDCQPSHQEIYYRRLTPVPEGFSLIYNLLYHTNNGGGNNVYLEDFKLYGTLDDALNDTNPWKCRDRNGNGVEDAGDFDHGATFYGECSPDGTRVRHQRSLFSQVLDKNNVAYYVYKPEAEGLQELPSVGIQDRTATAGGLVLQDPDTGDLYMNSFGNDIWSWNNAHGSGVRLHDDFHYWSEPAEGDHTAIVKVGTRSFVHDHGWQKRGIMFRKSLDPGSAFVGLFVSGAYGVTIQWRDYDGAHANWPGKYWYGGIQEAWIKLEKRIDMYTIYYGTETEGGIEWEQLYSRAFPEVGDVYNIGLAQSSVHWSPVEAVFSGYEVDQYFFPSAAPSVSFMPTRNVLSSDINVPALAGSAISDTSGSYVVRGAGYDIWGGHDQFHYAHFDPRSGNLRAEIKINSFAPLIEGASMHSWAKAGIMMRQSLEPGSPYNMILVSGGNGVAHHWRHTLNHGSGNSNNWHLGRDKNIYLRMDKVGSRFWMFTKVNEEDDWAFFRMGDVNNIGESFYVGIAVTSHDVNSLAELRASGWTITEDIEVPAVCAASDPDTCGCAEVKQADYRGFQNVTVDGDECQAWADQAPHAHTRTAANYPNAGLEANYCRNPDGEPGAWCYTKNPDKRWALCDVPVCGATARNLRAP